jgi:hypothetical protein
MSRTLFALLFGISSLFGSFKFDYQKDFDLKKDEIASIKITKRANKDSQNLNFRWTLYSDDKLVLLVKYDNFPTQYLLQKEYKRNSIKIYLRDDYLKSFKRAYLILQFVDFKDKRAHIKALISDPSRELDIEFDK